MPTVSQDQGPIRIDSARPACSTRLAVGVDGLEDSTGGLLSCEGARGEDHCSCARGSAPREPDLFVLSDCPDQTVVEGESPRCEKRSFLRCCRVVWEHPLLPLPNEYDSPPSHRGDRGAPSLADRPAWVRLGRYNGTRCCFALGSDAWNARALEAWQEPPLTILRSVRQCGMSWEGGGRQGGHDDHRSRRSEGGVWGGFRPINPLPSLRRALRARKPLQDRRLSVDHLGARGVHPRPTAAFVLTTLSFCSSDTLFDS